MKIKLPIDEATLNNHLTQNYNLDPTSLSFIPKGETSWGYVVETRQGKYFLKIFKKRPDFLEEASALTYKLYAECGITEIVHAIKSQQEKTVNFINSYPAILFNFIEGIEIMDQQLDDKQIEKIGRLLGKIHATTTQIGIYPKKEIFVSKDKEIFLQILERIKKHNTDENEYQKQTIDLLMPLRNKLMHELIQLEEIGNKIHKKNVPFVICHSDPTGGNILSDAQGRIYLIDWDTPLLAPKERDIFFFADRKIPFMKGYKSVVGDVTIDQDITQYYLHEWNVQEIADFGNQIFFENSSNEQNEHDLAKIKEFLDYSNIGIT